MGNRVMSVDTCSGEPVCADVSTADEDPERGLPGVLVLGAGGAHRSAHKEEVSFSLPVACAMKVRVYSVRGELIRVLFAGRLGAGRHSVLWDGTSERGLPVPPGLYLCRLEASALSESHKLLVVR